MLKTVTDRAISSKFWTLHVGTVDPGYNACEKFLILGILAAILNFGGEKKISHFPYM